jgi:hypothetical protein
MKGGRFSIASLTKVKEYWGDGAGEFSVQLHVELCSSESAGGEAFVVSVISPAQLARELSESASKLDFGRGLLLMLDYDENVIIEHLQKFVSVSDGSDWVSLRQRVSRYFNWLE